MSMTKQTISAQIPVELAIAVEELARELDRSKSWVIKEALTSLLDARERRNQAILAGLKDVDEGKYSPHSSVLELTKRLKGH